MVLAMMALQNGLVDATGMKRRKSCVLPKPPNNPIDGDGTSMTSGNLGGGGTNSNNNISSRAKSLIGRAMGRAGEHRHLIEVCYETGARRLFKI